MLAGAGFAQKFLVRERFLAQRRNDAKHCRVSLAFFAPFASLREKALGFRELKFKLTSEAISHTQGIAFALFLNAREVCPFESEFQAIDRYTVSIPNAVLI